MNQLLFSLILRLDESANLSVPSHIVQGLVKRGLEPEQINKIIWQYKVWTYINTIKNACHACGGYLGLHQKEGTTTCSPRCHKIEKRHPITPFNAIQTEAKERLELIQKLASNDEDFDVDTFPWHKITNGYRYVLHH